MMEASALAESTAIILGFHASSLISTPGSGGDTPPGQTDALELWQMLQPSLTTHPRLYDALTALAQTPSEATMSALREDLTALYSQDQSLAAAVEKLIARGSYAKLVGQTAWDTAQPAYKIGGKSATFAALTLARRRFDIRFFPVGFVAPIILPILGINLPSIAVWVIIAAIRGWIAWDYARKIGIPDPAWLGAALIVPGSFFPVYFTIRGWVPAAPASEAHTSGQDRQVGSLEPWARRWMTIYAILPLPLLILLTIINVLYMLQIFDHWIGILLLIVWLGIYIPALIGVRRWYGVGRVKSGKQYGLLAALLGVSVLAGLNIVLLGPALVRLILTA